MRIPRILAMLSVALTACSEPPGDTEAASELPVAEVAPAIPATTEEMIARANRLELDTPYVPPPGDPDAHFTMGFARTLCSGVFVSGLDADFAAENIGYFTSPYETRKTVVKRDVDYDNKTVSLTTESGITSNTIRLSLTDRNIAAIINARMRMAKMKFLLISLTAADSWSAVPR